ncbi:MAG: rubrerythrin family protein [Candidatus Gracilibacteria bacterium]|nr:rubrerythrin family protein [Candidatus Gracilibacteria bacterium]
MNNNIEKKYPKTYKSIMEAFAGESMARNKYDFFAKIARKGGHPKLDDFFRETSKNEYQHAKLLYKLVGGLGDTQENLKTCIEGEEYEHETMYPDFAEIAKKEGFKEAELLFRQLAKIELEHAERFKRLLKELDDDTLYDSKTGEKVAWICQVCGNVEYGINPPEVCPVCAHPKGHFERMQDKY